MKITKKFMKDFRSCNTVVVRFSGEFGRIELINEKCGKREKITTYEFTEKSNKCNAFWYVPYKGSTNMEILRHILKVGDTIRFTNYENSSEYTKNAGLHMDELVACIHNDKKKMIKRLVLEYSICPNNSARAIQPF